MSLVIVKEEQGNAVFVIHFAVPFNQLYIINKTEDLVFINYLYIYKFLFKVFDPISVGYTIYVFISIQVSSN